MFEDSPTWSMCPQIPCDRRSTAHYDAFHYIQHQQCNGGGRTNPELVSRKSSIGSQSERKLTTIGTDYFSINSLKDTHDPDRFKFVHGGLLIIESEQQILNVEVTMIQDINSMAAGFAYLSQFSIEVRS